ncbi:hypothetical protein FV232_09490 [Methylobacterium sp. WL30]|nr:hypothetical protein FV225_03380 [Methylobacterium sp. WL93]TXN50635.1 hypothetical protein FV227_11250 [Methylobacterium sp. WL119]TXN68250.1 hypothetical protein FV232_09490 [Methylobacterium sp. WL30]
MVKLQRTGSRAVLDLCAECCASPDPRERQVAAAVLGQLRVGDGRVSTEFHEVRYQALLAVLLAEVAGPADARVLASACVALGHLYDPRSIPAVVGLHGYPDPDVRYAVVHGLMEYDVDEAVVALIALSADVEAQVRGWATFALGQQIKRDTPAARVALRNRLPDPDCDRRAEALCGLARRGDVVGTETLIAALRSDGPSPVLLEVAIMAASPTLCPALRDVENRLPKPSMHCRSDPVREAMTDALRACGCGLAEPISSTAMTGPICDSVGSAMVVEHHASGGASAQRLEPA